MSPKLIKIGRKLNEMDDIGINIYAQQRFTELKL